MATSINKKLRQFAKDNNHRLVGFMFESAKKTRVFFEGCVRVEDADKVSDLMNQIVKLSLEAKGKDLDSERHESSLEVG